MLKPKNIIIFAVVGIALVLIYVFFINKAPEQTGLVSTSSNPVTSSTPTSDASNPNSLGSKDFLAVLLNVKTIKLDNSIFSNVAFSSLHDSSIVLTPDGTEGRINPFAPIGSDAVVTPINTTTTPNQATQTPPTTTPTTPKSTKTTTTPSTPPSTVTPTN
ncbi:MAG: hypothetical protein KGL67_01140 [Patescibacteria group bacterium]|nr:hypothetical protein [Patescibacteria group bacterium]